MKWKQTEETWSFSATIYSDLCLLSVISITVKIPAKSTSLQCFPCVILNICLSLCSSSTGYSETNSTTTCGVHSVLFQSGVTSVCQDQGHILNWSCLEILGTIGLRKFSATKEILFWQGKMYSWVEAQEQVKCFTKKMQKYLAFLQKDRSFAAE